MLKLRPAAAAGITDPFPTTRPPRADRFKRMLGGSLSKEPPCPNGETGSHQHKQISVVKVASGDGPVYVGHCDGREENASGNQIWFHQKDRWVMCVTAA